MVAVKNPNTRAFLRRFVALCLPALLLWAPTAGAAPVTVCVATLENLGATGENYWLGHFLSDSIAKNLEVLPGFKISRAARDADSVTDACAADYDFRVAGTFSYGAAVVVVRAQCIPAGASSAPAEASFVSSMSDLYPHLTDLSVSLAGFSGVDYSHSELARIRRPPTLSPIAVVYYGKAMASPSQSETRGLWLLRAISEDPSYTDALSKLGIHYYETGRTPEALVVLNRLLEVDPYYPNMYYNLGLVHRAAGDYAEAIEMYRIAVKLRPLDSEAWNNLGASYYLAEKREEAVAAFEQTLRLDPENPRAQANLLAASRAPDEKASRMTNRRSDVERLRRRVDTGAAFYADGDYWRAVEESEKALEIDPENFKANNNAGLACLKLGELQKAYMHFKQALRADPSAEDVRQNLAWLEPTLKKMQVANAGPADPVEEIVDPAQKARALGAAGRIHLARGSYEMAVDMFARSLQFDPENTASMIGLGRSYFGLAEYEMAQEQFSLAARLDRANEEAKALVAETRYVLNGNPGRRRQGLSAMEARASVVRGAWLSDEGRYARAKAEYLRALDFTPALTEALNNLAYVYQRLGEREQARAALKKAWLLNPENEMVARNVYGIDSGIGPGDETWDEMPFEIFVPGSKTEVVQPPAHSSDITRWEAINDSNVQPDSSERADVPHPRE